MGSRKVKTAAVAVRVPQSRAEATATITRIGELRREIGRSEADMNDQVAKLKERYELDADPKRLECEGLVEGLKTWCAANRDQIVAPGTKTADLGTGKVSWRARPPAVRFRGVEDVLKTLKSLGLQRFIRVKEEPNKDAMAAEPEVARAIAGVTIGSGGEDFIVEPAELELAA